MIENIVPTPKKVESLEGTLPISFAICAEEAAWQSCCGVFSAAFEKMYGIPVKEATDGICLRKDTALPPKSYRIDTRERATLSASDREGILYALATFLLMVKVSKGELTVERAVLEDAPEKDYRSLMIDLARQWHPARTIFCYIDLCFLYKINHLHLHFIDDQRYTLPSKAFPHITDGNRSYSYEELAAMNAYAEERGICIIPEFEVPGHARAMIDRYPEVFANKMEAADDHSVTETGDIFSAESLVCAGSPAAMEGIRTLLSEICELFPNSPYIHIGGDEANIRSWNRCPVCRAYMQEHGIEDHYELYSEFVGRVARAVLDLGKTPIVWEGFPPKGVHHIPKETIVCAWTAHYHLAPDLLKAGFKIINGSWKPLYIVPSTSVRWDAKDILNWNVYNWQHWWEKSPAWLNPINVAPTEQVLGGQYSVWECTYEQEISRVLENLPAFAERTWNVERRWSDQEFEKRRKPLLRIVPRLIQEM